MRTSKRYELSFKHKLCREFINGNETKEQIQNQYGIGGKSTLLTWLRKLGYIDSSNRPNASLLATLPKKESESKEIKELKARLLEAELRAEAYQRMIAIAEEKHNISIEKKSGSK